MTEKLEFEWSLKYRPRKVADCVLPQSYKAVFQQFVDEGNVGTLLLCGTSGVGKTTVAMAMLEEIGADYIIINGSLNGNIDTLRNDIQNFASSVSFAGGRKYVILDEADYLNANSTQPALRNFMEQYSHNCGFILTCNYKNRIIEALQSRCSVIDFRIPNGEKAALAGEFFKRTLTILDKENVKYDKAAVAEVVKRHFPDFRRCLNELQMYSKATGTIDTGILAAGLNDENFKTLINAMKEKRFNDVRRWIGENSDMDTNTLYRKFYDSANTVLEAKSIPLLVMTLAEYQHRAAFVVDQEINNVACMTEIMSACVFK